MTNKHLNVLTPAEHAEIKRLGKKLTGLQSDLSALPNGDGIRRIALCKEIVILENQILAIKAGIWKPGEVAK